MISITSHSQKPHLANPIILRMLLILIILLAFGIRFYGIKWGLPLEDRFHYSFHPDERKKLNVVMGMSLSKLDLNPNWFLKGTLQFYVIGAALKAFSFAGLTKLKPILFYFDNPKEYGKLYLVGRSVTILISILSIYLIYLIGKNAFNYKVGLLASFLTAILPAHVVNSIYMKTDIPMTFWVLLAFLFSLKIVHTGAFKYYLLTGLAIGFATATKYTAVPAIFLLPISHYLYFKNSSSPSSENYFINKGLLTGFLLVFLGFLIGCPYSILAFNEFFAELHSQYLYQVNPFLDSLDRGPVFWQYLTRIFLYAMGLPFLFLSYLGGLYALKKRTKYDLLILAFVIPYFIIISFGSWTTIRYSIPLLPFFMIFIARLIIEAFNERRMLLYKFSILILTFAATLYTTAYSFAYVDVMSEKDTRLKTWDWIETNIPEGSSIAFVSHYSKRLESDFYYPQISQVKYSVTHTPDDWTRIESADYVILSEFEYRQYLRLSKHFPSEHAIFMKILEGGMFVRIIEFKSQYALLGLPFPNRFPPHDWLYPMPKIIVFKRSTI